MIVNLCVISILHEKSDKGKTDKRKPKTSVLLLLLLGELIVCGFILTFSTATYIRSVIAPQDWSSGKRLVAINEFFWSPNIAVDPLGTLHIVYADFELEQVRFYYTKVDPATGSVTKPISVGESSVSLVVPSLAADREGNTHLALHGRENSTEIYYAKMLGFPPRQVLERKLSSRSVGCGEPSIAVDLQGNVHVVWHSKKGEVTVTPIDYELYYCKLDKNGNVIIPEKMITPADGYYSIKPSLTIDERNILHLTWIDNRNTEIRDFHEVFYTRLDREGRKISNETVVGRIPRLVNIDHTPAALVDRQGNTAFVLVDRSPGRLFEIYAKKIDTTGRVVFDRLRLASSRVFSQTGLPLVTLDSDDDICAVYADIRPNTIIEELHSNSVFEAIYGKWHFAPLYLKLRWHIFYSKINSSGQFLAKDRPLEKNPYSSSSPAIAVDSKGILHVVYLEDDREQYRLVHVSSISEDSSQILNGELGHLEKMLNNLGLSLGLVPIFATSNALFLLLLLLFSILLWALRNWTKSACSLLNSPIVLFASYLVLKYLALASGYGKVIQFYPGGLSQAITGILAAIIVRHGLNITKTKIESLSSYALLAAAWMILDTFYNLCLISPISIDPVY